MSQDLMITLGVIAIIAVAAFYFAFSSLRRARLIEDTPTSKIRSAAQGYVELIGTGRSDPQRQVISKLTGRDCLWHRFHIERHESSGKNSRWRTVSRGQSSEAIVLEDDTGKVFVHPERGEFSGTHRNVWYGNSPSPMGQSSGGLNLGGLSIGLGGRYRYTEELLINGDPLYVLGHFETMMPQNPEEQAAAESADLLREWKQDREAMIARFDTNGDGKVDQQEWEAARAEALKTATAAVRKNYKSEAASVIAYAPVRGQPLLISTTDPKKLARNYRLRAALGALGFVACCAAAVYLYQEAATLQQGSTQSSYSSGYSDTNNYKDSYDSAY